MTFSLKTSLPVILFSIVLSVLISISVDLTKDEIGALLNIYIPPIVGIITIIIIIFICLFVKNIKIRKVALITCASLNLLTGIFLVGEYFRFLNINSNDNPVKDNDKKLYSYASYKPGPGSVQIENTDGFPSDNTLVFSLLERPWRNLATSSSKSPFNINHDKVTIRITNTKKQDFTISKVLFSKAGFWKICRINNLNVDGSIFPITINPNSYSDITVVFTGCSPGKRVQSSWWKAILKFHYMMLRYVGPLKIAQHVGSPCVSTKGVMYLVTNDKTDSIKSLRLNSMWQYNGESDWEPDLQRIMGIFNLDTKVGFKSSDNGLHGDQVTSQSDEVSASLFQAANPNLPVKIFQIAAYHGCCLGNEGDTLQIYTPGTKLLKTVFFHNSRGGQMLMPPITIEDSANYASLNIQQPFGLKVGTDYTDRKLNYKNKIGIRAWKAIDSNGKQINNSYILGTDYLGTAGTNYDYQDNVYFIENVKPIENNTSLVNKS